MLCAYITVALILVSGLPAKSEEIPTNTTSSPLEDFVHARCLKYGGPDAFEELSSIDFFKGECHPQPYETNTDEELFNMACVEMPQQGQRCLEDLMSKIEPCLAPEEKYLPNFFLESFNTSVEEQCKDGMAHVRKLEKQLSSAECSMPVQAMFENMAEKCLSQLTIYNMIENDQQADFILKESDLCGDLLNAKECVSGVLRKHCEDGVFPELFETMIQPFTSWCQKHPTPDKSKFLRLG